MKREIDLINEINLLRKNPRSFVEKIRASQKNFRGSLWVDPKSNKKVTTKEGPIAYMEAIQYLQRQAQPLE